MSPCNTVNFDKTTQFTVITLELSFPELDLVYKKYGTPTIPFKIFDA